MQTSKSRFKASNVPIEMRHFSWKSLLKSVMLCLLLFFHHHAFSEASPTINNSRLAAIGEQETILNIPNFGRYAVMATSEQGCALQLVDRMTGPGAIAGKAGENDGRIDQFFEKGDYKIITHASEHGSGEVTLNVHKFSELHAEQVPRIIELKPIQTNLKDFQQISYWLEIDKRRAVAIEAAGRSLADIRLWKDGNWLVDTLPSQKIITPKVGKPLALYQLSTYLEPGMYLLTLYGGPAQTWSETSDEQPLYIRYGIPKRSVADRASLRITPFCIDRWLIPNPANYFRLALPEAKDAVLGVSYYEESNPFAAPFQTAIINKKSLPPVVDMTFGNNNAYQIVTVEGEAGQAYNLQHFERSAYYSFNEMGNFWVSTLHSGNGSDSIDATSILTARPYGSKERYLDSRTVRIDAETGFQRRFNLLDPLSLYLQVSQSGRYQVSGSGKGVSARFKIEPFLTSRPYNYRSPPFEDSEHVWDLDAGFYVLSIEPKLKGILDLDIRREDNKTTSAQTSVVSGTRYQKVTLYSRTEYRLYINDQAGVKSGIVLRKLPIELETGGLPIDQIAGESLDIPIRLTEPGIVRAIDSDGQALPFSIGDDEAVKSATLKPGQYHVVIKNSRSESISYSLSVEAVRLAANTPLPQISQADSKRPNYPTLVDAKPVFFDLLKNQTATYNVQVVKPALYRLETAGLLNTEGNLRTRTELSLMRSLANGVGRNFLIQQYLREGDYQLSIKTQGESQGHSELSLQQTTLLENGQLNDGIVARFSLAAHRGLSYRFNINQPGRYRLRALGPGEERTIRLEDQDGWPLIAPNSRADVEYEFKSGDYRVIILPSDTDSRVLTLLESLPQPPHFEGHGPHRLPLQTKIDHIWHEPLADNPRIPDQWMFDLNANADTTISIDNEMSGDLFLLSDGKQSESIAHVSANKAWQGRLSKGNYRLEIRNRRKNNRVEYHIQVTTEQLLSGQSRKLTLPGEINISLDSTNLIELSGFANGDIRAWLYDDKGQLIAKNDDRNDDWNFLIARHLKPGFYHLRVEALDQSTRDAQVSFRTPLLMEESALKLPAEPKLSDNALHLFPIQIPNDKTLLEASADSIDTVGVALEVKQGSEWQVLATAIDKKARILLPLGKSASAHRLRLRAWSVDRRGAPIKLHIAAYKPAKMKEQNGTLKLQALAKDSPFVVANVDVSQPGVFAIDNSDELIVSGYALRALQPGGKNPLIVKDELWLAAASNKPLPTRIQRLSLQKDSPLQLTLLQRNTSYLDIEPANTPLLVLAESRSGQVGVQLITQTQAAGNINNISFSERGMITTLLSARSAKVKLWNADQAGNALEATVQVYRFSKPTTVLVTQSVTDADLPGMAARQFPLSTGVKLLQLALPAKTAAIFSTKGVIDSQYWSGDSATNIRVSSRSERLTLLHADNSSAQTRLEIYPGHDESLSLAKINTQQLFRQNNPRNGILQIPVILPKDKPFTLRVRGADKVVLLQNDGAVLHGDDMELKTSGILQVKHQPGLMTAWLESRDSAIASTAHSVSLEKSVTLRLTDSDSNYTLTTKENSVLHIHSETALITRLRHADSTEQVQAYPNGVAADVYLPAGEAQLNISAVAGQSLSGELNLSTSPLIPISEGVGKEAIVANGGGQLFSFILDKSTTIGLGLQASSDLLSGVLMNAKGDIIGHGVVQMHELQAGQYIFAAYAPAADQPLRIRPVLIGTQPHPNSPPADIIRAYLEAAGVKVQQEGQQ